MSNCLKSNINCRFTVSYIELCWFAKLLIGRHVFNVSLENSINLSLAPVNKEIAV